MSSKIIWTHTDEAPALASYALLPVIQKFAKPAGVAVETADISVAARILAQFGHVEDELSKLGDLAKTPDANIIKLPNVSASVPQLVEAIAELQSKGYDLPQFVQSPSTDAEKAAYEKYAKVLGSAVNPVLREGNSDRRVAPPVKAYAQKNPHKVPTCGPCRRAARRARSAGRHRRRRGRPPPLAHPEPPPAPPAPWRARPAQMGKWDTSSKTHVSYMSDGDFFSTEVSTTVPSATSVRIELAKASGGVEVLKAETPLTAGEVIDASVMRKQALVDYLHKEMADAKANNLMLSLHLKVCPPLESARTPPLAPPRPPAPPRPGRLPPPARRPSPFPHAVPRVPPAQATMMKISDPILFGHAVEAFFDDVFAKHGATLAAAGANPRNGLADVLETVSTLPEAERAAIEADIAACYAKRPGLAMVDSDRGITNLHVPSDVIIDASVPCVVRDSGRMWNAAGELEDTKLLIPDRSYARFYAAVMDDCKANGQFDVATMGNVANVGLMAQKAEEYGSHDKTFEVPEEGTMRVVCSTSGKTLLEHTVAPGDIWRMCQTKDMPIKDWVRAVDLLAPSPLPPRRPSPQTPDPQTRLASDPPLASPRLAAHRSASPSPAHARRAPPRTFGSTRTARTTRRSSRRSTPTCPSTTPPASRSRSCPP